MLRVLLTVILPIALPLLIYLAYLKTSRRGGQAGDADADVKARARESAWLWIGLSGAALILAALITLRLTTGHPGDAKLESPRLIDGQVVPGHVIE